MHIIDSSFSIAATSSWRVDAEVRLRTTALQAAADASAQQGGQQAIGLQVGLHLQLSVRALLLVCTPGCW